MNNDDALSLWGVVLRAVSPNAIYAASWEWALYVSIFAPLAFAIGTGARLIHAKVNMAKGERPETQKMLVEIIILAFCYAAYIAFMYPIMVMMQGIYDSINAFQARGVLAQFFAAFADETDSAGVFSLRALRDSIFSAILFGVYIIVSMIYYCISKFLQFAHAFIFGLLLVTGPIFIPLAIWKASDYLKGWGKLWATILLWPIFEWIIMGMATESIGGAITQIQSHPVVMDSPTTAQPIVYGLMIIVSFLFIGITIAAPLVTNVLVTNSGNIAAAVIPFAAAGTALGAMIGKSSFNASKKYGGRAANNMNQTLGQGARNLATSAKQGDLGGGLQAVANTVSTMGGGSSTSRRPAQPFGPSSSSRQGPPPARPGSVSEHFGDAPLPLNPSSQAFKTPGANRSSESPINPRIAEAADTLSRERVGQESLSSNALQESKDFLKQEASQSPTVNQWLQQASKVADPNSHLSAFADQLPAPTPTEGGSGSKGLESDLSTDDKALDARKKRKGVFIDKQLKATGKRKPKS